MQLTRLGNHAQSGTGFQLGRPDTKRLAVWTVEPNKHSDGWLISSLARLLKSSILRPLMDLSTIETRLDCVDELRNNDVQFLTQAALSGIQSGKAINVELKGCPDVDKLISAFIQVSGRNARKNTENTINKLIELGCILEKTHRLQQVLQWAESPILVTVKDVRL
jgi:DNA mismatch repair protein MSH4